MRMGYEMSLRQVQKLVITPELRQAITVLQLPWLELQEYIETEMLENPVLELKDSPDGDGAASHEPLPGERGAGANGGAGVELPGADDAKSPDIDWQSYFDDASDIGYVGPRESREQPDASYESFVGAQESFQDHLMFQLHLAPLSQEQMRIGSIIIGGIDDNGYLRMTIPEVAAMAGVPEDQVEVVLKVIQGFEPSGVGARSLKECLLIQLDTLNLDAGDLDLTREVIQHHLDEVAEGKLAKIAERVGRSVAEVQKACDIVKTLDPKPGREFAGGGRAGYIEPDVVIERIGDDYVVVVNDVSAPRLNISPVYREMLKKPGMEAGAVEFVKSRLNSAMWLIRSIEQRRQTLYKVTECIVRFQRDFFDKGIKYLKPLTLKEVADEIGVHESTVSRATAGKYVQTPRGVYEMRFFFTSGIPTECGDPASSESVKRIIRDVIEAEDPRKPLSDQAIVQVLRRQGILISRRTVAKYRDECMIPASKLRRRF